MVLAQMTDRNATEPLSSSSLVYWISDGSTVGTGFLHVEGIDYSASYDFDAGDYGAWNTGITGTYYLHYYQALLAGPRPSMRSMPIFRRSVESQKTASRRSHPAPGAPRMIYRARLGWNNGTFSVTGFLNYSAHYYAPWGIPPNVNFQCTTPAAMSVAATFPCAISNYTQIEPSWYTFDLSLGYNTGDMPANDYLKRINIQLVGPECDGQTLAV